MYAMTEIGLSQSWKCHIGPEFEQKYMQDLRKFLLLRKQSGAQVFPPGAKIFNALNTTAFEDVKVVIIGQDPYHGPGQAHGLSFSVPPGAAIPPSLRNIYKELQSDIGFEVPGHGYLKPWAESGVLLLNAVLTVEHRSAGAHQGKGWESFTDRVIEVLNVETENLVFMLWGAYAQRKGQFLDSAKHCVLKAPHPSPLSAHRGFLGCQHFSRANAYLTSKNREPIDWQLPM
ncbi:MAG: uracil-DNA glycosylase [Xanthomonadales bacterium]|nr:uracil-DNA glycosylase [Xanthomonadales bacterium]